MTRPASESLRDIDEMEDAYRRYKNVAYPGSYHEERYQKALDRVKKDIGNSGDFFGDAVKDPETLIPLLRSQFDGDTDSTAPGDVPLTPAGGSGAW